MFQKRRFLNSIFIDLDGPILDVSERHYLVYRKIIEELKGTPLSKGRYWNLKKSKIALSKILTLSDLRDKEAIFMDRWLYLIERRSFLIYDRILPETDRILDYLRNNYRLILVTLRRSGNNLVWQLKKIGIRDKFSSVLYPKNLSSDNDRYIKYELIKNNRYLKSDSWIIGDTEIDISLGKKLRINTIAVLSGIRNKKYLLKYKPDVVLNSLKEITKIL
ncbi:MAG: HAD hydrolase-like protein [Candidatus Omnitrophica bacterium]|nr:HAD hydrolase-like protein [Candidatus Omnitrophota bacterium]